MRICWIKLWAGNVILTTAAIASSPCSFSDTTCDYSGMSLILIPHDLPANTTKLKLMNNSISLTYHDVQVLSNLTQLKELYLGYNLIRNLISGAFNNLKKLSVLELHNNCLTNIDRDIMKPLNLSHLTLYGNQWNCSCGLLGLQMWLNESKVHLGNENITTCETPKEMQFCTIKKALIKPSECFPVSTFVSSPHSATIQTTFDINLSKNMNNPALQFPTVTVENAIGNRTNTNSSDQSKFGKSWKLVVGVMATSIGISSTLVLFAKCINWYNCLFAYHHHRLQEEPELFMENTAAATEDSVPQALGKTKNSSQQTEVRTTPEEDDGYIEDGYIDSIRINNCEEQ